MPTSFDLRLRLYTPGGSRIRAIPRSNQIQVNDPLVDAAALKASYSARKVGELPDVSEIAVERWDDETKQWVEPRNMRFFVNTDEFDDHDPAQVHSITGVQFIHWNLLKALVEVGESETLVDGKRMFNSATPGAIMKTLLDENQALGWGPSIDFDFTASLDSAGNAWDQQLSIGYDPGLPVRTVLQNLLEQGVAESWTEGRTLRLFNPGQAADYSAGSHPLRLGFTATSLKVKRNLDDLATDLAFYGEDGMFVAIENEGAYSGLGRLAKSIRQGGVSDIGTATALGQTELTKSREVRRQLTISENARRAKALPWDHYENGDWLKAWIRGAWEAVRVVELVISKSNDGKITVAPVINDRFVELTARLAKRTNGITGGSSAGGTGAVPSKEDRRKPKAPTDLTATSVGYWADGVTSMSQVTASWTPVTQGINDIALDIDGYEFWGRRDDGASESQLLTSTDTDTVSFSPFTPDEDWLVKVRARSQAGVFGAFSTEVAVTTASPDEDLVEPVTPTVTTDRGTITVAWNGNLATDPESPAPPHLMQVDVEISLNEATDYTRVGTIFTAGGTEKIVDRQVGSSWYVRLVGVDKLGRRSDPSPAVPITVAGIAGPDLEANSVGANVIRSGAIEVEHLSGGLSGQITAMAAEIVLHATEITDNQALAAATAAALANRDLYFAVTPAGVVISRPGSPFSVVITDDRMEFRESGVARAWLEAGQWNAEAILSGRLTLGPIVIEPEGQSLIFRGAS